MYVICVESSHVRGMGHLFRSIVLYRFLVDNGENALVVVNRDSLAMEVLEREGISFYGIEQLESETDWETPLIKSRGVQVWINDRMDTGSQGATRIKKAGVVLVTIDDCGSGAELADIMFAPMSFDNSVVLKGKKVLRGLNYCILSPDVVNYRRQRGSFCKMAVTLGGSDTYGLTENAVRILAQRGLTATVFLGPSFKGADKVSSQYGDSFTFKKGVTSLIEEFQSFDCAITGGGVTAIEAAATGLPSLIVANELHEIYIAKHLEGLGCARYLGFREEAFACFTLPNDMEINAMSVAGINSIPTIGTENIYHEIKAVQCGARGR